MIECSKAKRTLGHGSLVVVGTGYQIAARITAEAASEIANAGTVFYLVYDWLDEVWLRKIRPNAVSLANFLKVGQSARECCRIMEQAIMAAVRKGEAVCVAFSGHPSICVGPTQTAVASARREGFQVRIIPGISSLDCLFADLCLDPTMVSCRVFDATRFLLHKHPVDHSSGLVLLQIARIGTASLQKKDIPERKGLKQLQEVLIRSYGASHEVIHYQAAFSPLGDSIVDEIPIAELHRCDIQFKSTLYVPPRQAPPSVAPPRGCARQR